MVGISPGANLAAASRAPSPNCWYSLWAQGDGEGLTKMERLDGCPASTQHPERLCTPRRNLEGRLPLGACRKAGEGNGPRSWQGDAGVRMARRSGGEGGPGAVKAGAGWIQIRSSRGLKIRGGMGGCFSGGMGGGTISMLRSPHS